MSDHYLRIVPADPQLVPAPDSHSRAEAIRRALTPGADSVASRVMDDVRVIDNGGNLERVQCPRCGSDLLDWSFKAIEAAHSERFVCLEAVTPCCATAVSLNDLRFEWPMGFARFVLEAMNPNIESGWLSTEELRLLEDCLGCKLRQIRAHY
jgi:hypothetical protein